MHHISAILFFKRSMAKTLESPIWLKNSPIADFDEQLRKSKLYYTYCNAD